MSLYFPSATMAAGNCLNCALNTKVIAHENERSAAECHDLEFDGTSATPPPPMCSPCVLL